MNEKYEKLKELIENNLKEEGRVEDAIGFNKLIQFLETETDWLKAPASTRFHNSFEGGLIDHCCNTAETILRIKKVLAPELSNVSCALVGLLHDVGKVNQYIEKEPTPAQKQHGYPGGYAFNENLLWMEHASRSLYYISKYIALTPEEWAAIEYHDQPYYGQSCAFKKNKLMTLLQNSDYWSCTYIE